MTKAFLSEPEQQEIIEAIRLAELNTSGEIRVHLEPECKGDPYVRAKEVFEQLGMHATEARNGVLFYLAFNDKKLAVLGDKGIHEMVSQTFWDEEINLMLSEFKRHAYKEGLCLGITRAGEKLKAYFPYHHTDTDELSNDISFGKGKDE